jgi:hypothetical protein
MAVTALLTLLEWKSLFPGRRDCLALAGFPISSRQIFGARFLALRLLFAAYVLTLNLPVAISFSFVTASPYQGNTSAFENIAAVFAALAGSCAFVFFSSLTLQGVLLNVTPARLFERFSLWVQGALVIAVFGAIPLIGHQPAASWWPPVWFLWLWESIVTGPRGGARDAALAIILPAVLSVFAYLISYHRHRRLLLEPASERGGRRRTGAGAWLLERWIRDPREQAAFVFTAKALARSGTHRMILLGYAGVSLGWIVSGMLATAPLSLRDQGLYALLVVAGPLAVSMLAIGGLRYAFSLPVEPQANWLFQTVGQEGRPAWLRGVERFVVWCAIAPIVATSFPPAIGIFGWTRASAIVMLTFLAPLICFEVMFRRWRKLPFTCSYLPGRTPVWLLAVGYGLLIPFLAPAGKLILYSSTDPIAFIALATFEGSLWWTLQRRRRSLWRECGLLFEEVPPCAVATLGLEPAREPHRESQPALSGEPPMLANILVASRGVLPQIWADEIREERRHPGLLLRSVCEDLRYGCRLIRRNPLFSLVAVLTLTVGIGINASVFTIVDGLFMRPHVYSDPRGFVRPIAMTRTGNTVRQTSYSEYAAFRDHSRSLRQLAAWAHFPAFVGEDDPAGSVGIAVSCNFFLVDGLNHATAGRLLTADDCRSGSGLPAAILSDSFWRARFGADPRIVGRLVMVNNHSVVVVGVVPDRTGGWTRTAGWTRPPSIWVPYTAQQLFEPTAPDLFREEQLWLSLAGRLAPGYSRSVAQAELNVLARRQDGLHQGRYTGVVTTDGSWIRELELTATGRDLMLYALFAGGFNLVVFIACANVATLLLARGAARRRAGARSRYGCRSARRESG